MRQIFTSRYTGVWRAFGQSLATGAASWLLFYVLINWLRKLTGPDIGFVIKDIVTYCDQHPFVIQIGIPLVISLATLWITRVIRITRYGRIAKKAGLFYSSINATKRDIKRSQKCLKEVSQNKESIYIICMSGQASFNTSGTPLHESLHNVTSAQIVLLYPLSQHALRRGKTLNLEPPERYSDWIYESIEYLEELVTEEGKNIQLKFYLGEPSWKYILLDNHVWVQQYPAKEHVSEAPCYAFESTYKQPTAFLDWIARFLRVNFFLQFLEKRRGWAGAYNFIRREIEWFWTHDWRLWSYDFNRGTIERWNPRTGELESKPIRRQ